ncbi:MAG: hypothetical protein GQ565_10480 [Candidatus Aegiribacteria sp.]|nr:hypothetical protein [Candidatus Aegiribacteria sp.]
MDNGSESAVDNSGDSGEGSSEGGSTDTGESQGDSLSGSSTDAANNLENSEEGSTGGSSDTGESQDDSSSDSSTDAANNLDCNDEGSTDGSTDAGESQDNPLNDVATEGAAQAANQPGKENNSQEGTMREPFSKYHDGAKILDGISNDLITPLKDFSVPVRVVRGLASPDKSIYTNLDKTIGWNYIPKTADKSTGSKSPIKHITSGENKPSEKTDSSQKVTDAPQLLPVTAEEYKPTEKSEPTQITGSITQIIGGKGPETVLEGITIEGHLEDPKDVIFEQPQSIDDANERETDNKIDKADEIKSKKEQEAYYKLETIKTSSKNWVCQIQERIPFSTNIATLHEIAPNTIKHTFLTFINIKAGEAEIVTISYNGMKGEWWINTESDIESQKNNKNWSVADVNPKNGINIEATINNIQKMILSGEDSYALSDGLFEWNNEYNCNTAAKSVTVED